MGVMAPGQVSPGFSLAGGPWENGQKGMRRGLQGPPGFRKITLGPAGWLEVVRCSASLVLVQL